MRHRSIWGFVAVVLLVVPVFIAAQQATGTWTADAPRQGMTVAARRYQEIMSPPGGIHAETIVPALEQFIRDFPNFPRLRMAYINLLMFAAISPGDPDKIIPFADEAMAKFPNEPLLRRNALTAKVRALRALKKNEAVRELARQVLDQDTDPFLLLHVAQADAEDGPKLLDKAIAERKKNPDEAPALGELNCAYAEALVRTGHTDEGLKRSRQALDQLKKEIAEAQRMPPGAPNRSRLLVLGHSLPTRYESMAIALADAGQYDKALEFVDLYARNADAPTGEGGRLAAQTLRADIYARMGKSDLELEAYATALAASMDVGIRDKVVAAAAKTGTNPEQIFARARLIRKQNAKSFRGFELRSTEAETIKLDSLKAKAVLVDFFFPT